MTEWGCAFFFVTHCTYYLPTPDLYLIYPVASTPRPTVIRMSPPSLSSDPRLLTSRRCHYSYPGVACVPFDALALLPHRALILARVLHSAPLPPPPPSLRPSSFPDSTPSPRRGTAAIIALFFRLDRAYSSLSHPLPVRSQIPEWHLFVSSQLTLAVESYPVY
jgi:hypothetical protein